MDRRGFLKRLGFGAAALGVALIPKRVVEAAEKLPTETGLVKRVDWTEEVPLRKPPIGKHADLVAYDDPVSAHQVFDTDFGTVKVAYQEAIERAHKDMEKALFTPAKIGPVGEWGNFFGDNGDPSVWIDLESFYNGYHAYSDKAAQQRIMEQFEKRRRARRDKFMVLAPAPEGALYSSPTVPMEVQ